MAHAVHGRRAQGVEVQQAQGADLNELLRAVVEQNRLLRGCLDRAVAEGRDLREALETSNRANERLIQRCDVLEGENRDLRERVGAVEARMRDISSELPQNCVESFFLGVGRGFTWVGRQVGIA